MTDQDKTTAFTQALFRWHQGHYRDMAWRKTNDPYRILVSEIMLQQTGVERVRDKYAEFLRAFPNVRSLAQASLGDVIRVWEGLGYNRRAKFLHDSAKKIIAEHRGQFPRDFEALTALPGIGLSTAAALRAFAFGEDEPMIDTNVRRILVRVFFPLTALPTDRALFDFAKKLIPEGKGKMWNYAMLDVAATLCTARAHADECPFVKLHGPVEDFSYKAPQSKFKNSRRFYRGRVLDLLRVEEMGLTEKSLLSKLGPMPYTAEEIMKGLQADGLVTAIRGRYSLPK